MSSPEFPEMDLVVLSGHLSSEPTERELPSGDVMRTYEVTVREPGHVAASVPVVMVGGRPPDASAGDRVAVVGRIRRRFFRAGGATASRTEVLADDVVVVRRRRDLDRLMRRATGRLDSALAVVSTA
jgi:single-strand DNA-binding protein